MKYILLFTVCLFIIYGYYIYIKTKDILNPLLAFFIPVFVSVVVNLIFYDGGDFKISYRTYAIYLLGAIAFAGGCTVTIRSSVEKRLSKPIELRYNLSVFIGCKVIATIGTVVSFCYIIKAATCGVFGINAIRNIRWYSLYVEQNNIIGKYSIVLIEVIFCVYAYKFYILEQRDKKTKFGLFLFAAEYIIAIMTTMARTAILQFVIEVAYFFLCEFQNKHKKVERRKRRFKVVLLVFVTFCVMQFLAIKTEKSLYINEVTGKVTSWLVPYFGKQFYIFDEFILQHSCVTKGINSFGFLGRVLNRLGILIPEYTIQIPGGQVASFIMDPYTDFGVIGVAVVMLLNGAVIGYIYRCAVNYSGWWLIFYSVCLYSCVIAFYAFQFAMSSQLYFAVVVILLLIDNRFHLHIRTIGVHHQKYISGEC